MKKPIKVVLTSSRMNELIDQQVAEYGRELTAEEKERDAKSRQVLGQFIEILELRKIVGEDRFNAIQKEVNEMKQNEHKSKTGQERER